MKSTYSLREWITFFVLAGAIVSVFGYHVVTHAFQKENSHATHSEHGAPTVQSPATVTQTTKEIVIEVNEDGFSPKEINAKLGDKLIFKNTGLKAHEPGAGPHPSHESYPELEAPKALLPGESYEHVTIREGTFQFHDHLNEQLGGTLIISR